MGKWGIPEKSFESVAPPPPLPLENWKNFANCLESTSYCLWAMDIGPHGLKRFSGPALEDDLGEFLGEELGNCNAPAAKRKSVRKLRPLFSKKGLTFFSHGMLQCLYSFLSNSKLKVLAPNIIATLNYLPLAATLKSLTCGMVASFRNSTDSWWQFYSSSVIVNSPLKSSTISEVEMNKRSVDDNFARQACVYGASCYMKVHLPICQVFLKRAWTHLDCPFRKSPSPLHLRIPKPPKNISRILSTCTSFNTPERTPPWPCVSPKPPLGSPLAQKLLWEEVHLVPPSRIQLDFMDLTPQWLHSRQVHISDN